MNTLKCRLKATNSLPQPHIYFPVLMIRFAINLVTVVYCFIHIPYKYFVVIFSLKNDPPLSPIVILYVLSFLNRVLMIFKECGNF